MALINLICTRGGAATRSSQQHIATTKEETRCSSSSSSTCISVRDNFSSRAALRSCSRFTNAFGQLRTIATSSRQQEGEISHEIVLKLQSLDFGSAFGREDEEFVEREQVFADNLDLGSGIPPCLGWCALAKAARPSVTISFSSNFGGAISLVPLP